MKAISVTFALLLALPAAADVMSVFIWEAPVGHAQSMLANGMKAREMHQEMGATVAVGTDQYFRMHYVVSVPNAAARGKITDTLNTSEQWQTFMQEASQREGAGKLVKVYNMNVAVPGSKPLGQALVVFRYAPNPGQAQDVVGNATRAKQIHDKLGADASVNITEEGEVHYVLSFESWEAQGKFEDALQGNREWNEFWSGVTANPNAELVGVYRVTRIGS